MASYPALDIASPDPDRVLWVIDDFSPVAIDEHRAGLTAFFATATDRNRAAEALARQLPGARLSARDVDDGDWARRSQENLGPIVVGRLVVAPPWAVSPASTPAMCPAGSVQTIVIQPSMGFGTGHHATTRLCLTALQHVDPRGRVVLDVGTGSGVLTLAARVLGAASALGIDSDPDAIRSAEENLGLNPAAAGARFELRDLRGAPLPAAEVVVANLTGALIVKAAPQLEGAVCAGGALVLSGIQESEGPDVRAACRLALAWQAEEDGWLAMIFRNGPTGRAAPPSNIG